MFDFWQAPNCLTICSRVTLSMCSICSNSVLCFDDLQQSDIVLCVQYRGTLFCALMTLPCWGGRTLSRWPSWALRVRYLIWSVPWGNRGEKPVVCEGLFFWEGTTEHPRRIVTPMWERGQPRHLRGGQGIFEEEVCDLTLLTGWGHCVKIFLCQRDKLSLWYRFFGAGLLE